MRRFPGLLPVLAVLLCFGTAAAQSDRIIQSIDIDGLSTVSPDEVRSVIATEVGDDLTRVEVFKKVQRDLHRILALGFFRDAVVLEEPATGGVKLIYVVQELPRITKLEFDGNASISDKDLIEAMGYDRKSPPVAREGAIEALRQKVLAAYAEKGYPQREVVMEQSTIDAGNIKLSFHVKEGRKLNVAGITFHGNTAFSEKEIRRVMTTKKNFYFIKRKFNEDAYQSDLEQVRVFYFSHGYLDVQVSRGEDRISGDNITLVIDIQEGIRYITSERLVQGNTIFSTNEILAVAQNQPGEVFRYDNLVNHDIPSIERLYKDQGFVRVNVTAPYRVNAATPGTVDVVYAVDEGNRARLGKLFVHGVMPASEAEDANVVRVPMFTKEHVIRREIELESGEVLDWSKVREADRTLSRLGGEHSYFARREQPPVALDTPRLKHGFTILPTDDPEVVDLLLELEEREDIRFITFSGGYSSSYGPFVAAGLRDPNVFGYGQHLGLTAQLGTRRNRISLSLTEPHFRGSDTSVTMQLFHQSRDEYRGRDFDESRTGFGVTFGREITDDLSASVGYLFEDIEISKIKDKIYDVLSLPSFYEDRRSTTSALNFGVAYDTRDYDYQNSVVSGVVLSGRVELAGLGGTNSFVKFTSRGDYYKQLAEKWFFQTSSHLYLGAGYGDTEELPLHERFFIGGTSDIRGFQESSVGPKAQLLRYYFGGSGASLSIRDVFIGGELAVTSQNEVHYRWNKWLTLVGFFDWGASYREPGDLDLGELRAGAGLGLRIRVPVLGGGVLQVDAGVPISSEDTDEEQSLHFGFNTGFGF